MLNQLKGVFASFQKHDVQTSTPGLDFLAAWKNRQTMEYQGQRFFIVSKADLVASKKASGLEVDLEDVRLLTLDDSGEQK